MQESIHAAMTVVRSRTDQLGLEEDFYEKYDFHVHVPEGATPKDGPSAGITMACALYSLLIDRPIRNDLGMTGELTLTGKILPIGGVKEKTMAAVREGLTTLIFPAANKSDVERLPENIKGDVKFHFVETYDEVFRIAYPDLEL